MSLAEKEVNKMKMIKMMLLRKKKGMTQEELANEADISRMTIYNYENGNRQSPDVNSLKKIADALDVTLDYLLDEDLSDI